jgi:hypothetical protein
VIEKKSPQKTIDEIFRNQTIFSRQTRNQDIALKSKKFVEKVALFFVEYNI